MQKTVSSIVFEHVISCRSCNKALLVTDPRPHRTTADEDLVGLAIKHHMKSPDNASGISPSCLALLVETESLDPPRPQADTEASSVSRQVICMEDCAIAKSRRQISQDWGLRWINFEQHFGTIAAWSGGKVGDCWCECHRTGDTGAVDGGTGSEAGECTSADSVLGLVGEQSVSSSTKWRVWETRSTMHLVWKRPIGDDEQPVDAEIPRFDQFILSWREQCQREGE